MKHKIFIDGQVGTTGLQIFEKLKTRKDVELLALPDFYRKNLEERIKIAKQADILILCLPDDASIEMVKSLEGTEIKIIDTSTAYRTHSDWIYGFPELNGYRNKIAKANRVANPGCYATGFIALIKPLIEAGYLSSTYPFSAHGISGYSGGGKSLIKIYEKSTSVGKIYPYSPYQLELGHKHIREMQIISEIDSPPLFFPSVGHFFQGMLVQVPLHEKTPLFDSAPTKRLNKNEILKIYHEYFYNESFVKVLDYQEIVLREGKFLDVNDTISHNRIEIIVSGQQTGHVVLVAKLDNLGKGASGSVIQNINIMLGLEENISLD